MTMIKTEKGSITINGSVTELMADFSVITNSLYKNLTEVIDEEYAREKLEDSFERGFKDEEEVVKENKTMKDLLHLIKKLAEEVEEGEE